ncbi:MAG: Crp/Fnr family transcriptional regulator [Alphaproteobacteria bacterium]
MQNIKSSAEHTAPDHPLFAAYPQLWGSISQTARLCSFDRDEEVIHHGDAAGALWLVVSGWVKITRQTPDGKETVIGLCTHGDVFGEAALFLHANYPYNAQVLVDDTRMVLIAADAVRRVVERDASIASGIMSMLNERISQTQLKFEHMSTMSASQRLGCFLLRLCHTQANGAKTLQIPVEKHILAAYLGMKPETLSRSQQQLKPLGVSVAGHDITISNIQRLREFVCNSCSESGSCDAEEV